MLHAVEDVKRKIKAGQRLLLAGSEQSLAQLPPGRWIGGTIPYFMGPEGGICTEDLIFVNEAPDFATSTYVREYRGDELPAICADAPENGYSFLIIPAGSATHASYAANATSYEGFFLKPLVGWVAGVHLGRLGQDRPRVFNGQDGTSSADSAVVMHVELPEGKQADVEIWNVFKPGNGDAITFPDGGFEVKNCRVNGKAETLAEYIAQEKPDVRFPLTADYSGSIVNVSIQNVDRVNGTVKFYAPVFRDVVYRFATPVPDYVAAFDAMANGMAAAEKETASFSCNCILNYLYSELEGKRTGSITGPITFGEIAHQLLNQTLVQLRIHDLK